MLLLTEIAIILDTITNICLKIIKNIYLIKIYYSRTSYFNKQNICQNININYYIRKYYKTV
jgi:hypothetical protein